MTISRKLLDELLKGCAPSGKRRATGEFVVSQGTDTGTPPKKVKA